MQLKIRERNRLKGRFTILQLILLLAILLFLAFQRGKGASVTADETLYFRENSRFQQINFHLDESNFY